LILGCFFFVFDGNAARWVKNLLSGDYNSAKLGKLGK